MKKPLILLTFFAACHGCREQDKVVPVLDSSDYNKGVLLSETNKDSAFYYFGKVIKSSKDSLQIAMAYNQMAYIESTSDDYFGAQESALHSLKYLNKQKKTDYQCLSSDYNELGTSSLNLKKYDEAIEYYDQALKFTQKENFKSILLNNKAVAYKNKREFGKAIEIYRSILEKSKNDKRDYARVLSNLANTKWLQDSSFYALPDLMTALHMREEAKNVAGMSTSYNHLSDYYFYSHPDSAFIYATKMHGTAVQENSPDNQLEALQKLIRLGPAKDVKKYFTRFQYLNDSLQTARNATKDQFAVIRYDAEGYRQDNLVLQKDNSEKKVQIFKQRLGLIVALCAVVFLFVWYRKRRKKILLESRNTIREQQLKTSQKVHDVVANGIYHIMADIEHKGTIEKEALLDDLENLYEKSRDISYEQPEALRGDYEESIAALFGSFATETRKVAVAGNNQNLWSNVNDNARKEVKHILQELMINMKKHSQAQNVGIRFERKENRINIQYTDDGVGVPSSFSFGNGLTNTGNRITAIGGEIIFDVGVKKGLRIFISFPIA